MLLLMLSHELIAKMQSVVTGQAPIPLEHWNITSGGKHNELKLKLIPYTPQVKQVAYLRRQTKSEVSVPTTYVSDAHHFFFKYAERIATETEETAQYPQEKDMMKDDVQIEIEKKK